MKNIFMLFVLIFVIPACCTTDYLYHWQIFNTTEETITFYFEKEENIIHNQLNDSIVIGPNQNIEIYRANENLSLSNCIELFDKYSVRNEVTNNYQLLINIEDEKLWYSETGSVECAYSHTCMLTIEPEHLTKIEEE